MNGFGMLVALGIGIAAEGRLIGSAYERLSAEDRQRYEALYRAMARDVKATRLAWESRR